MDLSTLHGEIAGGAAALARFAPRIPLPWAALLGGVGILFLLHGARRRIVLAVPGGAAVGALAARLVTVALDGPGGATEPLSLAIAAGVGALVCGAWPSLFPPLALALPGMLAGWLVPVAGRPWIGALAGGAAGAALGAFLREWVACLAAGGIGAAAVLAGALGLLGDRGAGPVLAEHPMALAAAGVVLAVAGAAFHAGRGWPEERRRGGEGIEPADAGPRAEVDGDG